MNHSIISSNGEFLTRDGKSFPSLEDAQAHSLKRRQDLEARWGYEISDSVWNRQGVRAGTDSRSFGEQVADKDYSPKKRETLDPLSQQIARYEQAGAKKREADEYKGLNLEERLALDLRKKRARQDAEQQAAAVEAAHLESNSSKIEAVKELRYQEQFNPNSDQRFREQLRKLELAYQTVDADPAEIQLLESSVNDVLLDRQSNKQAALLEEREALEAALQRNSQQLLLADPEPEKSEHVSDPNSYEDPMAGLEPSSGPAKLKVNRNQTPFSVGYELYQAMQSSGGFTDDQVNEVWEAVFGDDDSALNAAIDKYAE